MCANGILWPAFSAPVFIFGQWILARETVAKQLTRLFTRIKGVGVKTRDVRHTSHPTGIRWLRRTEVEGG